LQAREITNSSPQNLLWEAFNTHGWAWEMIAYGFWVMKRRLCYDQVLFFFFNYQTSYYCQDVKLCFEFNFSLFY
jgi:hypothetical protein